MVHGEGGVGSQLQKIRSKHSLASSPSPKQQLFKNAPLGLMAEGTLMTCLYLPSAWTLCAAGSETARFCDGAPHHAQPTRNVPYKNHSSIQLWIDYNMDIIFFHNVESKKHRTRKKLSKFAKIGEK